MKHVAYASSRVTLGAIAGYAVAVLLAKVLVSILFEYRWYFPADFEASAFLIGRQQVFTGLYSIAFYAHILSAPWALVLAAFLMLSGRRGAQGRRHARVGRLLIAIVTVLVVPSGMVMAYRAHAGALAGWGFALLAVATAGCAIMAALRARAGRLAAHRQWATRCFLLLCSPLLLRVATGASIVLDLESERFYIFNAWLSWLIPLAIYEVTQRAKLRTSAQVGLKHHLPVTS